MATRTDVRRRKAATRTDKPKRADSDPVQVEDALASFQVIRSRRLLQVFNLLPGAVLIATILFMFGVWFTRGTIQLSFATAGFAAILCMLIIRELYARFPRTLLTIWRRKVLRLKGAAAAAPDSRIEPGLVTEFIQFIRKSEDQLNGQQSGLFGLAITLLTLWIFWPFNGLSPRAWLASFQADWFSTGVTMCLFLIYYVAAFVGGLILWRVLVIARRINRIGIKFDFNLQVEHPDGCGGFRPIGDLCLTLASTLAPLLVAAGGWLVALGLITPAFLYRYLYITAASLPFVTSQLQVLTALLVALSLLGFFQPLASIHEAMSASKARLQDELDHISEEIHETSLTLRANAENLSAEEGQLLEEKIDFLRRVYNRSGKIPTWPINYEHVWGLLSLQAAPVIGIATSALGLVNVASGLFK